MGPPFRHNSPARWLHGSGRVRPVTVHIATSGHRRAPLESHPLDNRFLHSSDSTRLGREPLRRLGAWRGAVRLARLAVGPSGGGMRTRNHYASVSSSFWAKAANDFPSFFPRFTNSCSFAALET